MTEGMTTVLYALKSLSAVCDGAASEDGQGFNGVDTNFGKQLAKQDSLSFKQATSALKMLKKYNRQLAGFGITLPKSLEDEKAKTFEYNFNKSWLVVRFNHIPSTEVRAAMKEVEGWKYAADKNNAWVFPASSEAYLLLTKFIDMNLTVSAINGEAIEPEYAF